MYMYMDIFVCKREREREKASKRERERERGCFRCSSPACQAQLLEGKASKAPTHPSLPPRRSATGSGEFRSFRMQGLIALTVYPSEFGVQTQGRETREFWL